MVGGDNTCAVVQLCPFCEAQPCLTSFAVNILFHLAGFVQVSYSLGVSYSLRALALPTLSCAKVMTRLVVVAGYM